MKKHKCPKPDTLVALLKEKRDLTYLKDEGWYRIPVKSAPKAFQQVEYLAFYQPKGFDDDKWRVRYYGRKGRTKQAKRIDLLPREASNCRRDELYYRIEAENLQQLGEPILSKRG